MSTNQVLKTECHAGAASPPPRSSFLFPLFSRPSLVLAFPVLAFEGAFYSLSSAVIPDVLVNFFDNDFSKAQLISGMLDGGGSLLAFLLMPIFGLRSDKLGRKPFIVAVTLMLAVQSTLLWLNQYISLYYFLASKLIGKVTTLGLMYSYVSFGMFARAVSLLPAIAPTLLCRAPPPR